MSPLDTLKALRPTYPTPMSPDQLGSLMNAAAWAHRAEGYGVLSKPTGANCQQPQTGILISRDILVLPDGRIFDCLIDAEGRAEPTWSPKEPVAANRWRPPVDASVALPPRPPEPDRPPAGAVPYNEGHAIEFGLACNAVYLETTAPIDAGMIAVHASRAAWDYYVGGLSWPASLRKHVNEFRQVYDLPPR